jgi:hypothetical protein
MFYSNAPTSQTLSSLLPFIIIVVVVVIITSRDGSVGITLRYGLDGVRFPAGTEFLSSPPHPDLLWGPSSLLSNG